MGLSGAQHFHPRGFSRRQVYRPQSLANRSSVDEQKTKNNQPLMKADHLSSPLDALPLVQDGRSGAEFGPARARSVEARVHRHSILGATRHGTGSGLNLNPCVETTARACSWGQGACVDLAEGHSPRGGRPTVASPCCPLPFGSG